MNTYVDVGGATILSLRGAVLVYQGSRAFATWHEAKQTDEGAPFLGEARPLTTEFVHSLSQELGSRIPVEILPENILVRTAEMAVWWTPPGHRTMFFRDTAEDALALNGKRFPQPPLVWRVSGRELSVRAMKENARPTAGTKLFVAPYWNVDGSNGSTCQGSMRSPEESGVAAIAQWERAFFQSEFTHQNGALRLTSHPEGFLGLWMSIMGNEAPFPVDTLCPANQTLLEFVSAGSE